MAWMGSVRESRMAGSVSSTRILLVLTTIDAQIRKIEERGCGRGDVQPQEELSRILMGKLPYPRGKDRKECEGLETSAVASARVGSAGTCPELIWCASGESFPIRITMENIEPTAK